MKICFATNRDPSKPDAPTDFGTRLRSVQFPFAESNPRPHRVRCGERVALSPHTARRITCACGEYDP